MGRAVEHTGKALHRASGVELLGCVRCAERIELKRSGTEKKECEQDGKDEKKNRRIRTREPAPLRLIIPFRYGNRHIKAIQEIIFATPGLPAAPLPA